MKIVTEHVYPPIPLRQFDWSATTDNYEPGYPLEYGPTEEAAVKDLLDNHCKDRGADTAADGSCALCFAEAGTRCGLAFIPKQCAECGAALKDGTCVRCEADRAAGEAFVARHGMPWLEVRDDHNG